MKIQHILSLGAATLLAGMARAQEAAEAAGEHAAEAVAEHAEEASHSAIPFISLYNTNFVVLLAFLLFIAVLAYLKVPARLGAMLDARAEGIRSDLNEARALREEAQTILASYERKQREVSEQADRIIETARREAQEAARKAKVELQHSIARRLASAQEQIASAEAKTVREVRDTASQIAIAAAGDVIAASMTAAQGNGLIDEAIDAVKSKLH